MIIRSKVRLRGIIDRAKRSGKSVLIKKGVFDIIHPGHIFALKNFKRYADVVVILIQSDELTGSKKGPGRPINGQRQRAEVVDGISGVDYVFMDRSRSREEYIKVLNYLKPTVLAVTAADSKKTRAYSSPYWELKEFPDKRLPGYSTTEVINRVLKKLGKAKMK